MGGEFVDRSGDFAVFGIIFLVLVLLGVGFMILQWFRKVEQGTALVRSGLRGKAVSFTGMLIYPIIDKAELMDIKVKKIEIARSGKDGLICKDNLRADISVTFFVRVNDNDQDVLRVATSIGCERASDERAIEELFNAKFSEALKTVGRQFEFEQLYDERENFRDQILKVIGNDLNGFVLDDCSIDYLEQTAIEALNPNNILDSEGIKKITDLTSEQAKLSNNILRDKEKVIKKQDVEAREAILELERQQAEAEAKQQREVDVVRSRERAESEKVAQEQLLIAERARITTEEEVHVAEQNKERSVIVAQRNKEKTDAVEMERVKREQELESIERERVTALKDIEKEKAVETEKRDIQEVIRERVEVEKSVVAEKERIKDTEADATAEREKRVAITLAEKEAEERLVQTIKEAEAAQEAGKIRADEEHYVRVKLAEAGKTAAELEAEKVIIEAEAEQASAEKIAEGKKMLAEAVIVESSAEGLGEAEVIRAQGEAEAEALKLEGLAEAEGINAKAEAMKLFDEVGREHEEFKITLEKEKEIELAGIEIQKDIAEAQAGVMGQALKSANIDLVGGDVAFLEKVMQSVTAGKTVDRLLENSTALTDIKETFFNSDPDYFKAQIRQWIDQFGVTSEDLKNLSISAVLSKMLSSAGENGTRAQIQTLLGAAKRFGMEDEKAGDVIDRLTRE